MSAGLVACGRSGATASGSDAEARGAAAPLGKGAFEGIVRFRAPGIAGGDPLAFEVKGARSRWNLSDIEGATGGYRIYDATARRLFTVLPKQPSVTIDDVPSPAEAADGGVLWSFTGSEAGKVAGYPCQRSHVSDGVRMYVMCAVPLPIPLEYGLPNVGVSVPFLSELEARGELPLAVTVEPRDADGGGRGPRFEIPKLLASEVRATPLDDSRFVVPDFPVTHGRVGVPRALPR
jgi:hypothetical protein